MYDKHKYKLQKKYICIYVHSNSTEYNHIIKFSLTHCHDIQFVIL